MLIESLDGDKAIASAAETRLRISVTLLDNPHIGNYVLVHAGFAIRVIDEDEAQETAKLLNKIAIINRNGSTKI